MRVLAGVQGECGVALRLMGGSERGVEVEGVDNARVLQTIGLGRFRLQLVLCVGT